jgi:hypothetical protein
LTKDLFICCLNKLPFSQEVLWQRQRHLLPLRKGKKSIHSAQNGKPSWSIAEPEHRKDRLLRVCPRPSAVGSRSWPDMKRPLLPSPESNPKVTGDSSWAQGFKLEGYPWSSGTSCGKPPVHSAPGDEPILLSILNLNRVQAPCRYGFKIADDILCGLGT